MNQKQFLQFQIKKVEDNGDLTIVASDETLDRAGEVLSLGAWDLANYRKNPVLLVDHDYRVSNIVGRAKNLRVDDKAFTFSPVFHGITQLAKEVEEMVKSDFAPAVSVGFIPHGPEKDGDSGRNELLEISFVAVPANPNALSLAMKSVKDEEIKKIEEWVEKTTEKTETENDVVKELETTNKLLVDELAELKEGRVLSGKNRKRIEDAVSILKQASEALVELLSATDQTPEKDAGDKSRELKVSPAESKSPGKVNSRMVRALQRINSDSNRMLRELKD